MNNEFNLIESKSYAQVESLVEIDIINLFNQILRLLSARSSIIAYVKFAFRGINVWHASADGKASFC